MKSSKQVLAAMVDLIHQRLADASRSAEAAKACASVDNLDEAIRITLDIEQPLYEVTTLLNAASLIKRISDDSGDWQNSQAWSLPRRVLMIEDLLMRLRRLNAVTTGDSVVLGDWGVTSCLRSAAT